MKCTRTFYSWTNWISSETWFFQEPMKYLRKRRVYRLKKKNTVLKNSSRHSRLTLTDWSNVFFFFLSRIFTYTYWINGGFIDKILKMQNERRPNIIGELFEVSADRRCPLPTFQFRVITRTRIYYTAASCAIRVVLR